MSVPGPERPRPAVQHSVAIRGVADIPPTASNWRSSPDSDMPRRLLDHLKSEIAQGWVIVGTATQWPVRPTADLALLAKRMATGIFVLYNSHGDWSAGRPHHARGDVGRPRWVLADIEICCDADHKRFLRVRTRCYGERETVARSFGLMRPKVGGRP